MNKRVLSTTLIIASVLAIAFIYQPYIGKTTANIGVALLIFDQISPSLDVYQGDIAYFGGTVFNNRTETFRITNIAVDVFHYNDSKDAPNNHTLEIIWTAHEIEFPREDVRYHIEPNEARTVYFGHELNLTVKDNYLLILRIQYKDINSEVDAPNDFQIGNNVTINVNYRRPPAPTYIWAVLAILTSGILSIVIIGLVNWIREKRAK